MVLFIFAASVIFVQVAAKSPEMCGSPVDLAFVIDTSASIGQDNFDNQIKFVNDIVNLLNIGPGPHESRVAAVSFSSNTSIELSFSDKQTKKNVLKAVNEISYIAGDATRTYKGLKYTHDKIFAKGNGERKGVKNVVMVLTDGGTNAGHYDRYSKLEGKAKTLEEASKVKGLPAIVYAIGIGPNVDVSEIEGIASQPSNTFSMLVESYDVLNTDPIKNTVLRKLCPKEQKNPPCTVTKADVMFVVDESSSLHTASNFQKELNFVGSVIDSFDVERSKVRVGLMTFGNTADMKFHLNDFKTKKEIASILKTTKWHGGDTYLDKAFQLLMAEGLSPKYGRRSRVPQIAVVITDGQSTKPSETEIQIRQLKKKNYIVFAIGVGPERDPSELAKFASSSNNVFEVENLDGLTAIRKQLLTELCEKDQPKPTSNPNTCKEARADIYFVADSSTSIGTGAFGELKKFANSVVGRFDVGRNGVQFGLITFATNATFQFGLNTYRDKTAIRNAISNVHYSTGNTNTHKALEILVNEGYSSSNGGGRPGVPKIAIVITDGGSRNPAKTKEFAEQAKKLGITMFSIGVGPYIDPVELNTIASSPATKYSFHVDKYAALGSIENSLSKNTCLVALHGNKEIYFG